MSEWFADEELWRIFGDCMFREERFTAARTEVDDLLNLVGAVDGGWPRSVLDLGCGPGRHTLPLAARGLAATGLDLSQHLLAIARQRAADTAPAAGVNGEIEWLTEDMRRFERKRGFDLIVSMWTSFGYFDDLADDRLVLQRCHQNLLPGGVLLIDVVGKEYVTRHIEPVHLTEYDDGSILIERPVLEDQMTRYANQWILLKDGQYHTTQWHNNLYSGQELKEQLLVAGFAKVDLYGSLDGADYDLDAERLIAVARK